MHSIDTEITNFYLRLLRLLRLHDVWWKLNIA